MEYLGNQVRTLKKAFSTLSDCLTEEVDAVRQENDNRFNSIDEALKSIANNQEMLRDEILAVKKEAGAYSASVDSRVSTLWSQWEKADASIVEMKSVISESVSAAKSSTELYIQDEIANMSSKFAHLQEDVSVLGGKEKRTEGILLKMEGICARHDSQISSLGEAHDQASSALAQDIAALADECSDIRTSFKKSFEGVFGSVKVQLQAWETQQNENLNSMNKKLEFLKTNISYEQDRWSFELKELTKALEAQHKALTVAEEGNFQSKLDSRASLAQLKELENTVSDVKTDITRLHGEQKRVRTALGSISDLLQAQPVGFSANANANAMLSSPLRN